MIRLWMCDECKNLHGAAVDECVVCGSEDVVEVDVGEPVHSDHIE